MFVQQIDFATDDLDAMLALADQWAADAMGEGTVLRTELTEDRDDPGHYEWLVEFESAETAQTNSDRPETAAFSSRFAALCTEGPTFRNLEVLRAWPS